MSDDVTLSTYSYSFVFLYFFLSIIVFVGLYRLKQKANNKKSYFLFVIATIVNIFSSIIQGLVFNYGSEILDPIINIKFQDYDNVWYASIIFAIIYLSQLPTNLYYKEKSKKNDRDGKNIT
ncbi:MULTISPECIES: hypothetical protein [Serratia]|uniref:Uncharacterized protein n=2 Tax=Serratia TaxID=613 RepID=A0A240C472_SERFI|nr:MULTISPECIES: hypothetical protein [Serratia]REF44204.1 hypothetical protein C7332_2493 [Serratia ficaria]USU99265.1 hypothetical protein KFQ06_14470 [Serratia entomophila]CAI0725408.1 Uncharacterised protein [Serratia entomophila]CAI0728247.1 Uncharacterised protein [Serratia entomophila]CAI0729795.1 Uncharacterised protein [Serratia entomophila]